MKDDRYQFQPWWIKLYRRVRHVPPGYLRAAWFIIRWLMKGAPLTCPTYWAEAKLIWMLGTALIDIAMKRTHYTDEIIWTEYKLKPWYIRACRWWRHMPPAVVKALLALAGWMLRGCPKWWPARLNDKRFRWTRWREAKLIWTKCTSIAHINMGNYVTLADYIRELKRG